MVRAGAARACSTPAAGQPHVVFTTLELIHPADGCPRAVKCQDSDRGTGARVGAGEVQELALGQLTSTNSSNPFNPPLPHLVG